MTKAFCIKCGSEKQDPHKKCSSCDFVPEREIDIVKSVWLSTFRVLNEEELAKGKSPEVSSLSALAQKISDGRAIEYPKGEIEALLKQKRLVEEEGLISPLWFGFAFMVIPIIAIIVFIFEQIP